MAAEGAELAAQGVVLFFGAPGAPALAGQFPVGLAGVADEALHRLAELPRLGIGGPAFEQGQFLFQFLGLGFDVGQTGLPVLGPQLLVDSIRIGDKNAVAAFAEDLLGRLAGAMRIQMEKRQVVIAGVPDPIIVSGMAPGGFVGMHDGQGADLLAKVFVERPAAANRLSFKPISAGGHEAQAEEILVIKGSN